MHKCRERFEKLSQSVRPYPLAELGGNVRLFGVGEGLLYKVDRENGVRCKYVGQRRIMLGSIQSHPHEYDGTPYTAPQCFQDPIKIDMYPLGISHQCIASTLGYAGGHTISDRLENMRANPAAGWRMSDIEAVCREHGVTCAPPRGGGSHYKVAHAAVAEKLTIPFNRPIKPIYIRRLVAFLDAVRART